MKCCKECKHFTDGRYSKIYISPVCIVHGGDDASFMRQYICGIEAARFYQPKIDENSTPKQPGDPVMETGEGTGHAQQFNN